MERNKMKTIFRFHLGIIGAVCLASALRVSATQSVPPPTLDIANGTYVFTETDGNNYSTGSTVTFYDDTLTSWDIMYHYDANNWDTYLPSNSHVVSYSWDGVLGPNDFSYHFESDNPAPDGDPSSSIGWASGVGHVYDNPVWGAPLDPSGTWTPAPVPDGGMTVGLLGGALVGVVTLRRKQVA